MFLKKTYEERYVLRPLSKGRASANGMPFAERVFPGESLTRIITNPKKFYIELQKGIDTDCNNVIQYNYGRRKRKKVAFNVTKNGENKKEKL